MMNPALWDVQPLNFERILQEGSFLDMLYLGVKVGIYPPLIFLGMVR